MNSTPIVTERLLEDNVRFPRVTLSVTKGPDKGTSVVLEGQTVVVGTDDGCQLRLTDSSVSRRHVELFGGPGGYRLRDLRSTNGVLVEGVQIFEARLKGRARIGVGRTELRFEPERQEVQWPLSPHDRFGEALGQSTVMRRVFAVLEKATATSSAILLEGELGTGKELLARAVHASSPRAEGPFAVVDVGSASEAQLDAQLFGTRGAPGALHDAQWGTLFLDEVGLLSPTLQARLIRVLEGKESRPPGAGTSVLPDVRLTASSTKDLEAEVKAGRFREDLFFKLATFRVRVPPLRERVEDIPMLVRFHEARLPGGQRVPAETLEMLNHHEWRGNVRELFSVVERLGAFPDLGAAALSRVLGGESPAPTGVNLDLYKQVFSLPFHQAKEKVTEAFEKAYLSEHLKAVQGVVTHAAQRIGLPRQSLHRMLKRLGLQSGDEPEGAP